MKIVISFIVLFLFGCKKEILKPSDFGSKLNSKRIELGLKTIDNSQSEIYGNGYDEINKIYTPIVLNLGNIDLDKPLKKASYYGKDIYLDPKTGKLIFEEDVYVSGKRQIGLDNYINEVLIYRYIFQKYTEQIGIVSSVYNYSGFLNVKTKWEYIHIYPLPYKNKSEGVQFYYPKLDYVTKQKADSLLKSF
jgi:hypothetical protein